jgi:hypothetical protein
MKLEFPRHLGGSMSSTSGIKWCKWEWSFDGSLFGLSLLHRVEVSEVVVCCARTLMAIESRNFAGKESRPHLEFAAANPAAESESPQPGTPSYNAKIVQGQPIRKRQRRIFRLPPRSAPS